VEVGGGGLGSWEGGDVSGWFDRGGKKGRVRVCSWGREDRRGGRTPAFETWLVPCYGGEVLPEPF
jgi:hypothetical protein